MTMNALFASVPIDLQRFELSSLPKHRERLLTGHSNRRAFEAERIRELERLFLKPQTAKSEAKGSCRGHPLSVGAILCRSEYGTVRQPSTKTSLQHRRMKGETNAQNESLPKPSQITVAEEAPSTNVRFLLSNGVKKEEPNSEAKDVIKCQDLDSISGRCRRRMPQATIPEPVHPTIIALLSDNKRGKGHIKTVENHFISAMQPSTLQTTSRRTLNHLEIDGNTVNTTSSSGDDRPRAYATTTARGGGQLEYDDPLVNPYCRNALVARHHQRSRRREAASTFPLISPREDFSAAEDNIPTDLDVVGSGQVVLRQEKTVQEEQSVVAPPFSRGRVELTESNKPPSTTFEDIQRRHRAREMEWITSYTPSLRLHNTRPSLGRVGYTDYSLTFNRVQADPSSKMYAGADERFRTIQRYPLETPNLWQLQQRKEKRQKELKYSDS
ncbi:unnamed protein product [Phytomonas sp. Hart1]|nr:unnamed protein product [Phytomonas sp. Hart1]|eukprot:CCW66291.1 unnamed protein product [Phytomonas sp. isolate Hart1]